MVGTQAHLTARAGSEELRPVGQACWANMLFLWGVDEEGEAGLMRSAPGRLSGPKLGIITKCLTHSLPHPPVLTPRIPNCKQ